MFYQYILKKLKMELNELNDRDKSINEIFQVLVGYALIEKTKHNPELNKAARKKVIKELEKTDLYKKTILRASKEN